MINTVYRLVAPRRFEIAFEDIDLFGDNAIVRPTNLSICKFIFYPYIFKCPPHNDLMIAPTANIGIKLLVIHSVL